MKIFLLPFVNVVFAFLHPHIFSVPIPYVEVIPFLGLLTLFLHPSFGSDPLYMWTLVE